MRDACDIAGACIASACLPALEVACTLRLTAVPDHAAAEWIGCTAPGSKILTLQTRHQHARDPPASSSLSPTFRGGRCCLCETDRFKLLVSFFFRGKKQA